MHVLKKFLILFLPLSVLAGCGTVIDGQTQTITLSTPGATDALCTLDNGNRYPVRTGETLEIMRSNNDLVADCYASGNRHVSKRIPSDYNTWSALNVTNGVVPGVATDHLWGGLYDYPSTVVVDFTGVPAKGFGLPAYHDKDGPNPYDQAIESYAPAEPKLSTDNAYLKRGIEKKNSLKDSNPFSGIGPSAGAPEMSPSMETGGAASSVTPMPVPKGSTADELTRSMNPTVFNP